MHIDAVAQLTSTGRVDRIGLLGAGLATGIAVVLARATEPAAASKRTKRIKTKRCRPQVDQCVASLTGVCEGDPTCLENLVCCDLFADCNAAAAVSCIFANSN
jgi:hypothetical protein